MVPVVWVGGGNGDSVRRIFYGKKLAGWMDGWKEGRMDGRVEKPG